MQLLDMIPSFPDEEKRDFMLNKVPAMTQEKKKSVHAELWNTFRELVAQIPMNVLMESDIPEDLKKKILQIEQKYLVEVQKIATNVKVKFKQAENKMIEDDNRMAEELIASELG